MLNEFSDKAPEVKPRSFVMRGEFWLVFCAILIGVSLILGFLI
jgi:hypothetical protein